MKIRTWISASFLIFAATTPAFPWGYEGHEIVGAIADKLLSHNAMQQVKKILGFSLQVAAPWPDCVRSVAKNPDGTFKYTHSAAFGVPCTPFEADHGAPQEQARMEDYVARNFDTCNDGESNRPCHELFHFADVALQRGTYDRKFVGTSNHDIVSAINACIAVLQDMKPPEGPFSIKDKKEALFLLAHFVGDLHQPLHVGAVYLDPTHGHQVDPDQTGLDRKTETEGGNSIKDGSKHLHSEWDDIPEAWGVTPDAEMLIEARAVPATPGPITGWAASWASETVLKARQAFSGLTFTSDPDAHGKQFWKVHFLENDKQAYENDQMKLQRSQLATGGARLAQILNAIWH
jgi:hypothetical protein